MCMLDGLYLFSSFNTNNNRNMFSFLRIHMLTNTNSHIWYIARYSVYMYCLPNISNSNAILYRLLFYWMFSSFAMHRLQLQLEPKRKWTIITSTLFASNFFWMLSFNFFLFVLTYPYRRYSSGSQRKNKLKTRKFAAHCSYSSIMSYRIV